MLIFSRHPRTYTNDFWDLPDHMKDQHSTWYQADSKITEEGREQAKLAGVKFREWLQETKTKIDSVIISPSSRTLEYGDIILPIINYTGPVFIEPLIREKLKTGCFANMGLDKKHVIKTIKENNWFENIDLNLSRMEEDWINGEENDDIFSQRIQKARDIYLPESNNQNTLALSHWLYGNLFLDMPECIHNCEFIACHKELGQIKTKSIICPPAIQKNPVNYAAKNV